MLVLDHKQDNTMFCMHGRHGSQSFKKFINAVEGFERVDFRNLDSSYYGRKIVVITRDPMERFMSGLCHYIDRMSGIEQQNYEYGDVRDVIKNSVVSSSIAFNHEKCRTRLLSPNVKKIGPKAAWVLNETNNCFKYHLGDPHLVFTNLSMILLVVMDLEVEVMHVENLDEFYAKYGYTDVSGHGTNRYSKQKLKQEYYHNIMNLYLESIHNDVEKTHFQPSSEEFYKLMEIEIKAYNALSSKNLVADCKRFCLELIEPLINGLQPHTEVAYLSMCTGVQTTTRQFTQMVSREHEFYPVINLLYQVMGDEAMDNWNLTAGSFASLLDIDQ